jgi:hypothetical protein
LGIQNLIVPDFKVQESSKKVGASETKAENHHRFSESWFLVEKDESEKFETEQKKRKDRDSDDEFSDFKQQKFDAEDNLVDDDDNVPYEQDRANNSD